MAVAVSQTTPEQRRAAKAHAILADSGQWGRGSFRDGSRVYLIRSQCNPQVWYAVDEQRCGCTDYKRRQAACKHVLAVQAHVCRLLGYGSRQEYADWHAREEREESVLSDPEDDARLAKLAAMIRND